MTLPQSQTQKFNYQRVISLLLRFCLSSPVKCRILLEEFNHLVTHFLEEEWLIYWCMEEASEFRVLGGDKGGASQGKESGDH